MTAPDPSTSGPALTRRRALRAAVLAACGLGVAVAGFSGAPASAGSPPTEPTDPPTTPTTTPTTAPTTAPPTTAPTTVTTVTPTSLQPTSTVPRTTVAPSTTASTVASTTSSEADASSTTSSTAESTTTTTASTTTTAATSSATSEIEEPESDAARRLRFVIGGLLGIAGLVSVLTVLYWRHTAPVPLPLDDDDDDDGAADADEPRNVDDGRLTGDAQDAAGPSATTGGGRPGGDPGAVGAATSMSTAATVLDEPMPSGPVLDAAPLQIVTLEDLQGDDAG